MKKFIVLMTFAIGLFIMLPSTSSGSISPPDQVSFVVEQPAIAPALIFALVPQTHIFVVYNRIALVPEFIEGQEKGGLAIEKSLDTYLITLYSNKLPKVTNLQMIYNESFRTCYNNDGTIQSQNLLLKNIQSKDRSTIRADS